MPRQKKPKYQMSMFKRSSFDDLLKVAYIDDFEFEQPPATLDVVRFGIFKRDKETASYVEYKAPKQKTRLRINL